MQKATRLWLGKVKSLKEVQSTLAQEKSTSVSMEVEPERDAP